MSETNTNRPEHRLRKKVLGVLGAVALAGVALGAQKLIQENTSALDGGIVAGVDAKVLGHRGGGLEHNGSKIHELIVEQCEPDIKAAEAGHLHQRSFNNEGVECTVDAIQVPLDQFNSTKDGDVITPAGGEVGDPIVKSIVQDNYDDLHPLDKYTATPGVPAS